MMKAIYQHTKHFKLWIRKPQQKYGEQYQAEVINLRKRCL